MRACVCVHGWDTVRRRLRCGRDAVAVRSRPCQGSVKGLSRVGPGLARWGMAPPKDDQGGRGLGDYRASSMVGPKALFRRICASFPLI